MVYLDGRYDGAHVTHSSTARTNAQVQMGTVRSTTSDPVKGDKTESSVSVCLIVLRLRERKRRIQGLDSGTLQPSPNGKTPSHQARASSFLTYVGGWSWRSATGSRKQVPAPSSTTTTTTHHPDSSADDGWMACLVCFRGGTTT